MSHGDFDPDFPTSQSTTTSSNTNLLDVKGSCVAATTANITISTALNNTDTIDGVTLKDGDRVLVKEQSDAEDNGIYVVDDTPYRATDCDTSAEVTSGLFTFTIFPVFGSISKL